ncbi:unnamed protein product [Prorocentrum cordatum]|uniref:Uncharacterized protein n=1 Tax=Prorocentrum cordatum TaxID=2364126 RepID=A0ABN9U7K4_9DINO|nr:unnamed protein product [Polarella glacialis]
MMQTVAQQVAHERYLRQTYRELLATEQEVQFRGRDAYVPRLVTVDVRAGAGAGQRAAPPAPGGGSVRVSYAEPLQSSRPALARGKGGGRGGAERPHVLPRSGVGGLEPAGAVPSFLPGAAGSSAPGA